MSGLAGNCNTVSSDQVIMRDASPSLLPLRLQFIISIINASFWVADHSVRVGPALCSLDVLLSVMWWCSVWEVRQSPASHSQGSIITIGTGPEVTAWAEPGHTHTHHTQDMDTNISKHESGQGASTCSVQIWCLQNKFANYDGNKRDDGNNGLSQQVNNKMFIIE